MKNIEGRRFIEDEIERRRKENYLMDKKNYLTKF